MVLKLVSNSPRTFVRDADFTPQLFGYVPGRWYGTLAGVRTTGTRNDGILNTSPFVVGTTSKFDSIAAAVATAGIAGTILRFGIYASTSQGLAGSLIQEFGTQPGDVISTPQVDFAAAITLRPALYFLALVAQGGAPSMVGTGNGYVGFGSNTPALATAIAPSQMEFQSGVSGALPAVFTATGFTTNAATLALRAAA